MPAACGLGALVTALQALSDRDALIPPGPEVLLALLVVSPWIAEDVFAWMPPRWLFAAVVVAGVAGLLVDPADIDFAPFLLVLLAAEIAATSSLLTTGITTLAAIGVMLAGQARGFQGSDLWIAGIVAAAAFGAGLQNRLRMLQQERAAGVERTERAAAEERQRIAREVHDVIAHSLSVTMLHVTGTRHLLETEGDVDEAVEALRDAERLGRQAMVDIRRTVGLLGSGTTTDPAPMPGLADIDDLVTDFRAAGLDVRYQVTGDAAGPSLATGLGLYRITQESLANVAKHAPGAAVDVCLDVAGDPLRLTVRNSLPGRVVRRVERPGGRGAGGASAGRAGADSRRADVRVADVEPNGAGGPGANGLGLPGMRQRAALLGGECIAGCDGGGWRVEVVVPASETARG
jgi:signal transduction histidine kinase